MSMLAAAIVASEEAGMAEHGVPASYVEVIRAQIARMRR